MIDFLKKHLKGDYLIWVIYFGLCVFSIMAVFSASSDAVSKSATTTSQIFRHIALMAAGFIILLIVYYLPRQYIKFGSVILLFLCIGLLFYLLLAGSMHQGAARSLGGLFQPSEFAKFALVVVAADFIDRFQNREFLEKYFKIFCCLVWITLALILPMNLSQAIILFIPILVMLIIGAIPWKKVVFFVGIPIIALVCVTLIASAIPRNEDNRSSLGVAGEFFDKFRFETWQGRFRNHKDMVELWGEAKTSSEKWAVIRKYDQVIYARSAIYDGKVGVAPGNSVWRNRLQEVSKDFIYALIVEEYGIFVGGIGVIFLYLWLLWRGAVLLKKVGTTFSAIVIVGSVSLIAFQAFVHIAVNVGFFPVTGQTLPLISKGGTSMWVMSAFFGLILGMSKNVEKEYISAVNPKHQEQKQKEAEDNASDPRENGADATIEPQDNIVELSDKKQTTKPNLEDGEVEIIEL